MVWATFDIIFVVRTIRPIKQTVKITRSVVISTKDVHNKTSQETISEEVTNGHVRVLSKLKTTVETEETQYVLKLRS